MAAHGSGSCPWVIDHVRFTYVFPGEFMPDSDLRGCRTMPHRAVDEPSSGQARGHVQTVSAGHGFLSLAVLTSARDMDQASQNSYGKNG